MSYLPKLFIRGIGNATSSQIYRVIEDLGFGKVTRINFRGNNAIAFIDWDIPNTRATRTLLQEGTRSLTLYHSDDRFWKVSAYKSFEEREEEFQEKHRQIQESMARIENERIEQYLLKIFEEERLEQERFEQEERDSENFSEPIPESILLDYGDVSKNYSKTRQLIKARIRLN